jgi:PAS domain S-box-containing protein
MLKPPVPIDERERLENLRMYSILDSGPERAFDDITLLASQICQTPISVISLIDAERQWFKSSVGLKVSQTEREFAFCGHVILGSGVLIVPDALKDERFSDNPWVIQDPAIRFYAGTPLFSSEGYALGALCVMDQAPRNLSEEQIQALTILGRQVVSLLNLRRAMAVSIAAEAEIKFIANRLSLATQAAKIGVWDWSLETNVITWDATMFEHYGLKPTPDSRVDYSAWTSTVLPEDLAQQEAILRDTIARRGRSEREFRIRHGDGSLRVIQAAEAVVLDERQKPVRVVGVNLDITKSRRAEEQIRHLSLHDALTGLPNRMLFADRVDQALQRLKRDPSRHFAVLFVDLDRFKIVNDAMGHAAGDVLLKTIAARLLACLRNTDSLSRPYGINSNPDARGGDCGSHTVARMGGDEFTLVLDGLQHPGDAAFVAQRVLDIISHPITFNGKEMTMTASIGIVNGTPSCASSHELLRDADSAMYRAKNAGKARYVIFDSTMHLAAVSRVQMESDLRLALERNELVLHYQPIFSLAARRLRGFEALVRWPRVDEEGNITMIKPGDFIPIAEDTGLIVPLGAWVLEEACRQMADWKHRYPSAANIHISINVSGRQLVDDYFGGHLRRVLRETKLAPETIRLEITESVLMDEQNDPMEKLSNLKATGVLLSMDDFGTGYSSLSFLHRFPIDNLKVDRSFVQNIQDQRHAAAVVEAVINLAHNLGMEVIAEGVATPEQLALLQSLDCDLVQGYLFSEPLSAVRAEGFFEESNLRAQAG